MAAPAAVPPIEVREGKSLDFVGSLLSRLPASDVLASLHSQVSSAVHANAAPYPVSASLLSPALRSLPLPVQRAAYDEAHSGRFSVVGSGGGTAACGDVLAQEDPFGFVREHLATGTGGGDGDGETAVFLPGMNTPHERRDGYFSYTAPERLVHYSRVLGGKRLAQLHTGTSQDQPPVRVTVEDSPFFSTLVKLLRRFRKDDSEDSDSEEEEGEELREGEINLSSEMIDSLQVVFSITDFEGNLMQRSIAKLILLATPESPLTFLAYSRASIEIAATLRQYIDDQQAAGVPDDAIEAHLRASITVVSIGAATSHWPDGPAYIHLGSEHDPVSNVAGVHASRPRGAGKDAVFLTTASKVYGGDGGENHNFSCLTSQYLSVVMLANKTTSFRRIYDLARPPAAAGPVASTGGSFFSSLFGRVSDGLEGLLDARSGRVGAGPLVAQGTSGSVFASFLSGVANVLKGFLPSRAVPVGGGELVIPENIEELMLAMIRVSAGLGYSKINLRDDPNDEIIMQLPSMEESMALLKKHFDAEAIDSIHRSCRDIFCEETPFDKPLTYQTGEYATS